ncbi:MAG: PHP domain-containing protein [Halobacteriota archaeon]
MYKLYSVNSVRAAGDSNCLARPTESAQSEHQARDVSTKAENKRFVIDLHVHSNFSPDSAVKPKTALKISRKKGLNGIAVTDHDTIQGGLEASRINTDKHFLVIVGSELETDRGDVIGLFLTQEIESRKADQVLTEIHEQGGLAVWAHPYREGKKQLPSTLIERVDIIEGYNAKTEAARNVHARTLAAQYKKPIVGVSDAHTADDIGGIVTAFEGSTHNIKQALIAGKKCIMGPRLSPEYLPEYLSGLFSPAQQRAERSLSLRPVSKRLFL